MTRSFRQLLDSDELIVAPGAYDAITARLVEDAGFPLVYMTGAGTAAARGYPDYGLLTMTEMVDNAALMARSVTVPVFADADTGFGNELNVTRTVQEYEARGVAGIHLEDQVSPKRCGHLDGKQVVDRDHFTSLITAAVEARSSADFIIVARTDAAAVNGLDDAIERANAALAAGADAAFVEAPSELAHVAAIPERVDGPCVLNLVPGGRTPVTDTAHAAALGYRIVICPALLLGAAITVGDLVLGELATTGVHPGGGSKDSTSGSTQDFMARFGGATWDPIRDRFDTAATLRSASELDTAGRA